MVLFGFASVTIIVVISLVWLQMLRLLHNTASTTAIQGLLLVCWGGALLLETGVL